MTMLRFSIRPVLRFLYLRTLMLEQRLPTLWHSIWIVALMELSTTLYEVLAWTSLRQIQDKEISTSVTTEVDYEKQKAYSLSFEAKDGGGKVTTVPLLVSLVDVNDNPPVWEASQYQRTVREGATAFQPAFVVRAIDNDKDGESRIRYQVVSSNSDTLSIDEESGEVKILSPVSSGHTSRGQYEMVLRAYDDGVPPLHSDVPVFVRVGVPGNQRPIFRGTPYSVTLRETATSGDEVISVRATDPDGPNSAIKYKLASGADNFNVDQKSGLVTVSAGAILDPDVTMSRRYTVTVLAVDNGTPIRETAQTVVTVNIEDINNKAPHFLPNANYIKHISERTHIGTIVLKVQAIDSDLNALLRYNITNVRAMQKSGVPLLQTTSYDFKHTFIINETTGDIILNSSLNYQSAAVIILTVEAKDLNAALNIDKQVANVEVTIYIEAYNEKNPIFTMGSWSFGESLIMKQVEEEMSIGSVVMTLTAIDPRSGQPVTHFHLAGARPHFFSLDPLGKLIVTNRIDYEAMEQRVIQFKVEAVSNDGIHSSEALISIKVEDINDHLPVFDQENYRGKVLEASPEGTDVLTVKATDGDAANSSLGYGDVRYSLSGDSAKLFSIDPLEGVIKVSGKGELDREKLSVLRLIAVASDTPQGGANQRKTSVPIIIEVEDINDNAPVFPVSEYSAVILENAEPSTSVLNITATDADSGFSAIIEYDIVHQAEAPGLFTVNQQTGEVKTKGKLTGKGRREPYRIITRAQDLGQPSLFSDVPLNLYVGDVVSNDGIPTFLYPTADQVAYISENSSIGSPVFRVIAKDPDDPNTLEGQVRYSFLQDGGDSKAFNIDSVTGLITTRKTLDREAKSKYNLLIVAQDSGVVSQRSTRQLRVVVTDIDDHKPVFNRTQDASPMEITIEEEPSPGTVIALISAEDPDEKENANIGYVITYGNENNLFKVNRIANNSGELVVQGRLDREQEEEYLITVKCFKLSLTPTNLRKSYDKQDLTERLIKIKLIDIDDNLPKFEESTVTVGVRVNVPVDTLLYTASASDLDSNAQPIAYSIESVDFVSLHESRQSPSANLSLFALSNTTGELRTAALLTGYQDGYFNLKVAASNNGSSSYAIIKIYIVRDRGLLKFVFSQPPSEVKAMIPDFKRALEEALDLPVTLNVYDTQFHSKHDGSLDFSATSSCFQLVGARLFDLKETESLLTPAANPKVDDVYKQYNVQTVQRCAPLLVAAEVTWVQFCVLGIAGFIGIASFVSGCVLCCTYRRW